MLNGVGAPVGVVTISIFVTLSAAVPEFVSVTGHVFVSEACTALGHAMVVGLKAAAGVPIPFPVTCTVWGLPAALSLTVRTAVYLLPVVGAKVTTIWHVAPGPSVVPQALFGMVNPPVVLASVMLVIVRTAVPVFESTAWHVAVCAA